MFVSLAQSTDLVLLVGRTNVAIKINLQVGIGDLGFGLLDPPNEESTFGGKKLLPAKYRP